MTDRHSLARSSSGIAILAALGVLTGFAGDAAMAALFGAGSGTDAFFVAATIPFALASLLLASANQALVPLINTWYADLEARDADRHVEGLLGTSLALATAVAVLGIAASGILPSILAPGASAATKQTAEALTALLFVTVITRVGAEVLRALLNARFSFAAPAAMPVVENVVALVVMVALADRMGVTAVAVGYVAGGVLQLVFIAAATVRCGLPVRPRLAVRDPEIRGAFRLLTLPLAGTGLNMVARAAERFLASFLPTGSITILNYAWVVVNSLGGAIFFRSVVVAILPRLSEAKRDDDESRRIVGDGIRIMTLISFPLTTVVVALAAPMIALAFQRGAFTGSASTLLAAVLAIYALQFPLDALTRVFLAFWYSRLDTKTPFVNVAIGVGLDIVLAVALFKPFGIKGIALAYGLSSIGNLVHGYLTVDRAIGIRFRALAPFVVKVGIASVISGAVAVGVLALMPVGGSFLVRTVRVAVPGAFSVLALLAALALLRVRLWRTLLSPRRDAVSPPGGTGP